MRADDTPAEGATGRRCGSDPGVVQPHPLLAVPPIVATCLVGAAGGATAAQRTFLVAGGGALIVEATTRAVVAWHWRHHRWPPDAGTPTALLPVLAVTLWALSWSLAARGYAVDAGVGASWVLAAIQFAAWLIADRRRRTVAVGPHRDESSVVTRRRTEEN